MISFEETKIIHNILIEKFGGSKGIRDLGLLKSALGRAYVTFDSKELYPSPIEKAAALFESVIINHPFIDGNKRTAYTLMRLILLESGLDIEAKQKDKYSFVISSSKGEFRFEEIKNWIQSRLKK